MKSNPHKRFPQIRKDSIPLIDPTEDLSYEQQHISKIQCNKDT